MKTYHVPGTLRKLLGSFCPPTSGFSYESPRSVPRCAVEFRAPTKTLSSAGTSSPSLLPGELLSLSSQGSELPNPPDWAAPCPSELWLFLNIIGNYLSTYLLVCLPPTSVSLGQGPCLCNCYFIRTSRGGGVCVCCQGLSGHFISGLLG